MLLSLVLILVVSLTATAAYMLVSTDDYDYNMGSAAVTLQPIVIKDNNNIPTSIIVKNVGNADARVRVQIVPMYRNISNGSIYWRSPVLNTDFSLDISAFWQYDNPTGTNYYHYYYIYVLKVGETTPDLLQGNLIQQITDPPKGYVLCFDVLFDAVQHIPNDKAALEAWDATYS